VRPAAPTEGSAPPATNPGYFSTVTKFQTSS
jgi:hypothetical protein